MLNGGECVSRMGYCTKEGITKRISHNLEPSRKPTMAVVEFDEDGKLLVPGQKNLLLERLLAKRNLSEPIYLIVYVHGWHNNAHDCINRPDQDCPENLEDDDYRDFEQTDDMMGFQALLVKRAWEMQRLQLPHHIFGVYIGWPGETTKVEPFSTLSVAQIASNADRVGEPNGELAKILKELESSLVTESRMLVMGHSFGGRVLTRVFSDINATGEVNSDGCFQPLGDHGYVMTINAAVEANASGARMHQTMGCSRNPHWINLTSTDDWATDWIFPIASFAFGMPGITNIFDPVYLETIGHYEDYLYGSYSNDYFESKAKDRYTLERLASFWYPAESERDISRKGDLDLDGVNFHYFVSLNSQSAKTGAQIFNLYTDENGLGSPSHSLFGKHSAFVATNWHRLIDGLVFHDYPYNPALPLISKSSVE
jgi:hypothetical protein